MDKSRITYISFMNVIAAVSVVILHADSSFWNYSTGFYWGVTNVIESALYFAVPIFFMLSGVTLIDYHKRYSTKEFFKKRFFKTVVPFLFWSLFGMLWASRKTLWAMAAGQPHGELGWTAEKIIRGFVNGTFTEIYWFFIPLFCIYMVIPFFAAIPEEKRVRIYTYAIFGALIFNYTIPFVSSVLKEYAPFTVYTTYTMFVSHQYLVYPLIGYVLHKTELKLKFRLIIYGAALVGLMVFMLGTYYRTREAGKLDGLFRGYYNLPCLLYSTGVFLFIKQTASRIKSEKVIRFFTYFQSYTFPIYLIHRYILDVLEENLALVHIEKASLLYVLGATVIAISLSVLITWLLRKIPVLRRVVP